jgi:hypothetical protein
MELKTEQLILSRHVGLGQNIKLILLSLSTNEKQTDIDNGLKKPRPPLITIDNFFRVDASLTPAIA